MIQPPYVTYEQAKLLKPKEYNEQCLQCYTEHNKTIPYTLGIYKDYNVYKNITKANNELPYKELVPFFAQTLLYTAPEQWRVKEWLRVKHNIDLQAICNYGKLGRTYRMGIIFINKKGEVDTVFLRSIDTPFEFIEFESPQEAYSAAFDYILKELI
jgi:hypothetical protein